MKCRLILKMLKEKSEFTEVICYETEKQVCYMVLEPIFNITYFPSLGDIYIVGCTNSGKSTLFNALLGSDMCKTSASSLIQRATVSPWPGTTLSMLKVWYTFLVISYAQ